MSTFTPIYDWISVADKELTLLEMAIIGRVLRWGDKGCCESNSKLAKAFHVDRGTIIRSIKKLIKREWLAPLPEKRTQRILYIDPVRLSAGPLFEQATGGATPLLSGAMQPVSGGAAPLPGDATGGAVPLPSGAMQPISGGAAPPNQTINQTIITQTSERANFEEFWARYPKRLSGEYWVKPGNYEAWEEWQKLSKQDQQKALTNVKFQKASKCTPNASTWLRKRRWEDFQSNNSGNKQSKRTMACECGAPLYLDQKEKRVFCSNDKCPFGQSKSGRKPVTVRGNR